ncbi:hypothetical protein Taro_005172 [Colocasia esculenta]|uniref:Uncharacterized protein n=1 Tax=Colocasia esculenta TaxID=4460 RepID=A0A843TTV3_COLES|nr:hypothetical protein [Colocasia esculenta]
MQGLVQAMQMQAHTHAALQAQLEAQAQVPAQDHGGPSTMERFKRMLPPSFKGESDPLLAERSPSSGSGSSASYRKTRKALSPSSSVCFSARGHRAGGACHRSVIC